MKKLAMYINGAFETGFTGQWRDVLNPATEEAIAQEPKGSGADVDRAVFRYLVNENHRRAVGNQRPEIK